MRSRSTPKVLVALLVTIAAFHAGSASSTSDAGSGGDAGNTRDTATALPGLGSYAGALKWKDVDWYTTSTGASGAVCIEAAVTTVNGDDVELFVERPGLSKAVAAYVANGTERLAVALPDASTVFLSLDPYASNSSSWGAPSGGDYTFTLSRTFAAPTTGDAGTSFDAGSTLATASRIDAGCTQGALQGLADVVDVYSVQAQRDETIWYSIASAEPLELSLSDASGRLLGYTVRPGELAGFTVDAPGTYYLTASRASASSSSPTYVVASTMAADPGFGCRPMCLT